jgi:SAM-dependent methyltransferase
MSSAVHKNYVGTELEVFAHAVNWKDYWAGAIRRYVGPRVLEVGAGIGSTIPFLCGLQQTSWVALEPDPQLAIQIQSKIKTGVLPSRCEVLVGALSNLDPAKVFDTILYIDVLEHIADDRAEVANASRHLADGGYLIVLAPAHNWLFTPFDTAVGHYRRYSRKTVRELGTVSLHLERIIFLDSVGLIASVANWLLLRVSKPTIKQIKLWDEWMVPLSRGLDPMLRYSVGKTIVGVWRKSARCRDDDEVKV